MNATTHTYLAERLKRIYLDPNLITTHKKTIGTYDIGKIEIALTENLATPTLFDAHKEFVMISVYNNGVALDHHYGDKIKMTDHDEMLPYDRIKDINELLKKIMEFIQSELRIELL